MAEYNQSDNKYTTTAPTTAVTFLYLDGAMRDLIHRAKIFSELSSAVYSDIWQMAAVNGLIPEKVLDNPYGICLTPELGGATPGISYNTLCGYGSGNSTLSMGLLHAKRIELICLLADLCLNVDVSVGERPAPTIRPGKGTLGATYPVEANYPRTAQTLVYPDSYSTALKIYTETVLNYITKYVNQYILRMESTYYQLRNLVRPYVIYTKSFGPPYQNSTACNIIPITMTEEINTLIDTMLMPATGIGGFMNQQRADFMTFLASIKMYVPGTYV